MIKLSLRRTRYRVFYAADTLIREAFSTMFDFVALDKISIIFVWPNFLEGAFAYISHPDEMHTAVAEALRDGSQRRAHTRQYRDRLFWGLYGQAS